MPITAQQLAAVLTRAANLRVDVQRAQVEVAPDNTTLLLVDVTFHQPGLRRRIEASALPHIQPAVTGDGEALTCQAILDNWLGPEPKDPHAMRRPPAWHDERDRVLNATPGQVIEAIRQGKRRAAPAPAPSVDGPADATPGDDLQPSPGGGPGVTEGSGGSGGPGEKMTRQQMIAAGMDAKSRHEQYKRQGGKHPDDKPATT